MTADEGSVTTKNFYGSQSKRSNQIEDMMFIFVLNQFVWKWYDSRIDCNAFGGEQRNLLLGKLSPKLTMSVCHKHTKIEFSWFCHILFRCLKQ